MYGLCVRVCVYCVWEFIYGSQFFENWFCSHLRYIDRDCCGINKMSTQIWRICCDSSFAEFSIILCMYAICRIPPYSPTISTNSPMSAKYFCAFVARFHVIYKAFSYWNYTFIYIYTFAKCYNRNAKRRRAITTMIWSENQEEAPFIISFSVSIFSFTLAHVKVSGSHSHSHSHTL